MPLRRKPGCDAGSCGSYLRVSLVVVLLGPDPAAHQVVPHGVGQGEVVVPGRRYVAVLHQREMEVTVETPLDLRYVPESGDAADTDLFPLLLVGQRRRHGSTKTTRRRSAESGLGDGDGPAESGQHLAGRAGRRRAATPTPQTLTAGTFQRGRGLIGGA